MNEKLTLTIEKEVLQAAKAYAKEKGQSLSELVENYLKLIIYERDEIKEKGLSPRVRKLRGIIKTDEELDYKRILEEELMKQYISHKNT